MKNINNTLSYYFTNSNFTNFKEWYKSIDLFNEIKLLLRNQIKKIFKKEPEEIYNNWINLIQPYCFQGGNGYKIQYSGDIPHHWCIKPEYYNKVSTIPNEVLISSIICDKYITISSKCETQYWSN